MCFCFLLNALVKKTFELFTFLQKPQINSRGVSHTQFLTANYYNNYPGLNPYLQHNFLLLEPF